ncbi:major facilitator superfamily domain-containing protein [Pseudomassariella vexata]|uniref:Major facilitator superfamily domain-containing protein n=1 Tax=Pseudomassariella vexata TaxID=1141098 RepID=A0A1Y2DQ77_9PEZI|nr:major facilitator superfamily domain-containing protein [Pseudomassariella vexata]ORY61442.1 major facilitator superfamily domain-containing protein [Pseudomassariella vexata]
MIEEELAGTKAFTLPRDRSRLSVISVAETTSRIREMSFIATICMAQLCAQAGLGQTLATLRDVEDSIGSNDGVALNWSVAGYSLAIGTFILIAGRLGDVFGHKRIFIAGFVWSALWATLSGLAIFSNTMLFTCGRVFQGTGAAMSLANGIALIGTTYPAEKRKSTVLAILAATSSIGFILGAGISSAFALIWWPIAYWVFALVLCAVAVVGYFSIASWPESKAPRTLRSVIDDLDIPGAVIGVASVVLINYAFNQAPIEGWARLDIWIALIGGLLLMTLFVVIERCSVPNPLVPLHALSANVALILGAVTCGWACLGIWGFYTWQFLQVIRGLSPLLITAWFSPVVAIGILAALTAGQLLDKLRPAAVLTISMLAFVVGTCLIALVPEDQPYWGQTFLCMCVISWAVSMSCPAAIMLVSNSMDKTHQGVAGGLVSAVINYSIALGIGIGGTVEKEVASHVSTVSAVLMGYRAALWMSVGLAGLGVLICLALQFKMYRRRPNRCCECHGMLAEKIVGEDGLTYTV